jgi:hypothetical protein
MATKKQSLPIARTPSPLPNLSPQTHHPEPITTPSLNNGAMSYSSMKNFSNFFSPEHLQKTGEMLRQPFAIAVYASLGFHALLGFGLPFLSSSKPPMPEQRPVNVVELSPLERSRLPQQNPLPGFSPTPKSTTPEANTPTSSVDVPLDPYASAPADSSNYTIPPEDSSTSPSESSNPKRSKSKPKKNTTESSTKNETDPSDETKKKPGGAEDLDGTKPAGIPDDTKLAALYTYNGTGTATTPADWLSKMGDVRNVINLEHSIRDKDWADKPLKIDMVYPQDACKFKHKETPLKGTVGFAVVVSQEGEIVGKPLQFVSSGFDGFNKTAADFVVKQWEKDVLPKLLEIKPKAELNALNGFQIMLNFEPKETDCVAAQSKPAS